MPSEDQGRGKRDDHGRDIVSFAGAVRPPIEGSRERQNQETCAERRAGLDDTHL